MDELNKQNISSGDPNPQTDTDSDMKKNPEVPSLKMEDILLDTENKNKVSAVRDPLFAARVLEEQKKVMEEMPKVEKPKSPVNEEEKQKEKKFNPNAIRTYRGDVTEMMKGQKTSLAQIIIAEQKEKTKDFLETSPSSSKNKVFKTLSMALIILGFSIIAGGVYYFMQNKDSTQDGQKEKVGSIIFAELYKEMNLTNLTGQKIINAIANEIMVLDIRLDYIEYIYPTESTDSDIKVSASAQTFFNKIDAKMPGTLTRSLEKEFMFGIHSFNENQPFVILKTNFPENAFAGMLEWEKNMARGLFPLFAVTANIYEKKFEDIIIKNRDIRVLFNENREITLLYTFFGKNTIIITTDKDTLDEVITRIQRP